MANIDYQELLDEAQKLKKQDSSIDSSLDKKIITYEIIHKYKKSEN